MKDCKNFIMRKTEGLEILAFPANNFKGQEPGTDEEIQQFCSLNYNVDFRYSPRSLSWVKISILFTII